MLISRSIFQNGLLIANSQDTTPNSNLLGNKVKLDSFIEQYERDILITTLGYDLYKELQSNLEVLNGQTEQSVKVSSDQKWKDLVNGKEYDGKVWRGLNYQEGSFKVSLLAYYTFWSWLNDNTTTMGSGGEVQVQSKNANNVNPTSTLVQIWNSFIEMYQGLPYNYCFPSVSFYNGATFVDYFNGGINSNYVSLLQFLRDNPTNYPNPQLYTFVNESNSNSLGL